MVTERLPVYEQAKEHMCLLAFSPPLGTPMAVRTCLANVDSQIIGLVVSSTDVTRVAYDADCRRRRPAVGGVNLFFLMY